jgi:hypothetical protein
MPIHPDWSVALDLGCDLAATEADVLYIEGALRDEGVPTIIYPWSPLDDSLTPLGATRPYRVLVPASAQAQARELALDVLDSRTKRSDVLLPADDAWALRYYYSAFALNLLRASRERAGVWRLAYELMRLYVFFIVLTVVGALLTAAVNLVLGGV